MLMTQYSMAQRKVEQYTFNSYPLMYEVLEGFLWLSKFTQPFTFININSQICFIYFLSIMNTNESTEQVA